jgi:L-lactate dehydrogenase complex protein LldG
MIDATRETILARLQSAMGKTPPAPPTACMPIATYSTEEKITKLKGLLEAMRAEVHLVSRANWVDPLKTILVQKRLQTLLYAPETWLGPQLAEAWADGAEGLPRKIVFDQSVEDFKETLFQIDAGITTTRGAIAETGAIVLWADATEPRTLSLVPPVHIAVLKADKIYNSFCEIIDAQNWAAGMPTNALLISGPSKTADIEMTLAFGVHGPKELIVMILQ